MTRLSSLLHSFFISRQQNNEHMIKRADPPSDANGGFANNSSQKTSFPAGTAKPTPTPATSNSAPVSSSSSRPLTSSSSPIPSSSSAATLAPSATLPPPPINTPASGTLSTPISPTSSAAADNSTGGGGLSGGAIGAIVAVILIVIGGITAFFVIRRRRQRNIAARAGAGAMRDPYNEGFSSFPPPPAPMAFTSDNYATNKNLAAGSASYQQHQQQQPIIPPSSSYQYQSPASTSFPITSPNIAQTPPMTSTNAPSTMSNVATTGAAAVSAFAATGAITGVAVNSVDNNVQPQPGDIWQQEPLGTFTVLTTYAPTLSDEIDVQPGDQVQVFEEYDDGWCLGINITRGQTRGVFPKHCVTPETQEVVVPAQQPNPSSHSLAVSEPPLATAGKRISSLYMENTSAITQ